MISGKQKTLFITSRRNFQTDNIFVSLIVNRNYFAIDATVQDINQLFIDVLSQK